MADSSLVMLKRGSHLISSLFFHAWGSHYSSTQKFAYPQTLLDNVGFQMKYNFVVWEESRRQWKMLHYRVRTKFPFHSSCSRKMSTMEIKYWMHENLKAPFLFLHLNFYEISMFSCLYYQTMFIFYYSRSPKSWNRILIHVRTHKLEMTKTIIVVL